MSSPFSLFRRHQRVLMVVTTGLAMISFVLLGAIQDPRDLPMPLVVIFLAAMLGGIFWLAGLSRGKGTDWGLTGVILGVVLGLTLIWTGQEPVAVEMVGGNLKGSELSEMMRQRQIANNFVQMAGRTGISEGKNDPMEQMMATQRINSNLFGFSRGQDITQQDVVLGEILRREADEMGMVISDKIVQDFIADVSGGNLTKSSFSEIRRNLQVSETALMDILRQEILAREAARLLSGQSLMTPQNQWDFFKKLSVTQSAQLVSIPVSSFVSESMQPTDDELQTLLTEFAGNMPGYTSEGRPEEGRPGFFQLPKMRIAYLEAVFDDIKETVGEVTEEEVQKRYEDEYQRKVPDNLPENMKPKDGITPPELPALPGSKEPPAAPTKNSPAETPSLEAKPENDPPEAKPEDTETPNADKAEEPSKEDPEAEKTGEATPKENSQSLNAETLSGLQFVALQDDEQKKEQPAAKPTEQKGLAAPKVKAAEKTESKPAVDDKKSAEKKDEKKEQAKDNKTPTAEKPTVTAEPPKDGEPADAKPEMKKTPAGDIDLPPAPTSDVQELDDELKATIREDILRERTQQKIDTLMVEAYKFANDLSRNYRNGDRDEDYVSLEAATEQIKEYAAAHHLLYMETQFLTLNDLRSSEDHSIGSAFIEPLDPRGFRSVTDELSQSIPTIMFQVSRARSFSTESRYIFWKTGFNEAYAPKSIDDEDAVRQQVAKFWKQRQADTQTQKRAEELAKMIRESDKPMVESLSDETVTGDAEGLFLTIRETGEFTEMTRGTAVPNNPNQQNPPRFSVVPGAEDAGQRFFTKVFDEMNEGDVGIAQNRDGSVYYLVRIKERSPSTNEEWDEMRSQFLSQGDQRDYSYLAQQFLSEFSGNWGSELTEKYNVQFFSNQSTTVDSEGS